MAFWTEHSFLPSLVGAARQPLAHPQRGVPPPELSEVAHLLLDGWGWTCRFPTLLPPASRGEAPAKGRGRELGREPSPGPALPHPGSVLREGLCR